MARLVKLVHIAYLVILRRVFGENADAATCEAGSIACVGRAGQKLALVTGGNRGIGLEVASGLLSKLPSDFDVVITSRRPEVGHEALRCLRQRHYNDGTGATCCSGEQAGSQSCDYGTWFYREVGAGADGRLLVLPLNLADDDSIDTLVEEVKRAYGRVDILVNNAAAPARAPHHEHMVVDHFGHLRLTLAVAPLLAPSARIVYVGSEMGSLRSFSPQLQQQLLDPLLSLERLNELLRSYVGLAAQGQQQAHGWPGGSGYGTAKMANGATTRILARELVAGSLGISNGSKDVLINACCPGPANVPHCQKGAHTIIHLATLPPGAGLTGRWFLDRSWSGQPQEGQW